VDGAHALSEGIEGGGPMIKRFLYASDK